LGCKKGLKAGRSCDGWLEKKTGNSGGDRLEKQGADLKNSSWLKNDRKNRYSWLGKQGTVELVDVEKQGAIELVISKIDSF
jgi:hypothetical protein